LDAIQSVDKINVLVVDGLSTQSPYVTQSLGDLGVNLITAQSGEEALRLVRRYQFAVILLDVRLPTIDGYETAARIHAQPGCAAVPILFLSVEEDESQKTKAYSNGAADFILSPGNPQILRTKVRVFIDLFQAAQDAMRRAEQRVANRLEKADREIGEAIQRRRRSSFLSETTAALAGSLDQGGTVQELARLSVPFLADFSAVSHVDARSVAQHVELAWAHSSEGAVSSARLEMTQLPLRFQEVTRIVLETGRMAQATDLPAFSETSFALSTVAIFPLRARSQMLGVLAVGRRYSGRPFGAEELLLAETLASRAAVILDNARMYRDIQESDLRKNQFLAMLADELRNPLAAIQGAAQMLGLADCTSDRLPMAQAIINRQVSELVRMLDELLDVARITQGKLRIQMEPVSLPVVVQMAVESSSPVIKSHSHSLHVSCPQTPLWVSGDANRLAQILANLLDNAAKYTDQGGKIWLTVERENETAVLRVRDNGIGISKEAQSSIFELFMQVDRSLARSRGGLGIGLTLAHQLVELHGGSIKASSEGLNQGSEFTVRLPLLLDPPFAAAPSAISARGQRTRRRVMLIDDNPDVANSLAMLLEACGHQVFWALDGASALAAAKGFLPDVVFLDIGLPELDGYEVARRLRSLPELSKTLLVALTGYGQAEIRTRAKQAGFDAHLVKPVDFQILNDFLLNACPDKEP
jgi:signal transduction histidine kinase/DNA-binding response OmpR family regulator